MITPRTGGPLVGLILVLLGSQVAEAAQHPAGLSRSQSGAWRAEPYRPPHRYSEFRDFAWIDYWLVCGPFPIFADGQVPSDGVKRTAAASAALALDHLANAGGESATGFTAADVIGHSGSAYAWSEVFTGGGKLDLNEHFMGHGKGNMPYALAYGYAEIESATESTRSLIVYSDDGVRVWWNGKLVVDAFAHHKFVESPCYAPIEVRRGVNILLVKVHNGTQDWAVSVQLGTRPGALGAAVENTATRFVDLLLKAGADPNDAEPGALPPLHQASHRGQAGMVRQLLDAGGDPNRRTPAGRTALDCALDGGAFEAAEILRQRGGIESATPASLSARIDESFMFCAQPERPGMTVAVLKAGKILYAHAYGLADIAARRPMTLDTRMMIGSVSKQIMATALLSLVESGRASLADPIGRWLPELPGFLRPATLRQVLSHQSGLPEELPTSGQDYYSTWPALVSGLAAMRDLPAPPGSKFQYSNLGFVLIARATERIAGRPLSVVLQERIFRPLGMNDSGVTEPGRPRSDDAVAYERSARGFEPMSAFLARKNTIRNHGAVWSTTHDLAKWVQAVEERKLLSARMWADAMNPGKLTDGSSIPTGAGWFTGTHRSLRTSYHTGHGFGYQCVLLRYPDQRLAVIVQTNCAWWSPWDRAQNVGESCLWKEMLLK